MSSQQLALQAGMCVPSDGAGSSKVTEIREAQRPLKTHRVLLPLRINTEAAEAMSCDQSGAILETIFKVSLSVYVTEQ